jgi:hypothetical protein
MLLIFQSFIILHNFNILYLLLVSLPPQNSAQPKCWYKNWTIWLTVTLGVVNVAQYVAAEAHSWAASSTANHMPPCDILQVLLANWTPNYSHKDHWLTTMNTLPSVVDGQSTDQDTSCCNGAQRFIVIHILMQPNSAPCLPSPYALTQTLSCLLKKRH